MCSSHKLKQYESEYTGRNSKALFSWPRSTSSEISRAVCYPSRRFPGSVCVSSEVQSAVRHLRAAEMIFRELPGGHSAASTRTAGVCVWGGQPAGSPGASRRPSWGKLTECKQDPWRSPKPRPLSVPVSHQLCAKAQGRVFTAWC